MAWSPDYLDFEKPIAELDLKLKELKRLSSGNNQVQIDQEIAQLEKKCAKLMAGIYANLDEWQIVQIARHPKRPYTLDYVARLVTDFEELHGDRQYADDLSIVGGIGRLGERPVAVVGHQKGRDTDEKIKRNFGMPRPEAYRKAARIFKLAERFGMPVLTFIDTPGAYPGIDAEERNQSGAIAENLRLMSGLEVPIVSIVVGEGGSGGALAIAVCDHLMMMEYSIYSVISPEGCASILWKNASRAADAARAMSITAPKLKALGLVDEIIPEMNGGVHRNLDAVCEWVKPVIERRLAALVDLPVERLLEQRYRRLVKVGHFKDG